MSFRASVGSDSFTYTIDDGHGGTATATVHMTVTNVNDPPVAQPDAFSMDQATTLTVSAPGVLATIPTSTATR